MSHVFGREQLYELVWSEPIQRIAKSLAISDVGLAKACRRANIPLPERGYWAKLQAGKLVVERPPLPPRAFGSNGNVEIGPPDRGGLRPPEEIIPDAPVAPSFPEPIEEVRERARQMIGSIVMPKGLTHPHSAINKLLQRDERRRERQATSAYPSFLDAPLFDSPIARRRLRILNAIFLALERCGGMAWTRESDARELGALIGDVQVSFKLDPIPTRQPSLSKRASEGKSNVSDGLRLELEQWCSGMPALPSWEDSDSTPLESVLTDICVEIFVSAEVMMRQWKQERYQELVGERQRLLEKARVKARQEEETRLARIEQEKRQRREQLLDEAGRWRQAADLRAYIRAVVESKASESGHLPNEIKGWADWATREADLLDPLVRKPEVSG